MDEQILPVTAQQREALFLSLYQKVFPAVAKHIAKKGGTLDDAKDVFQDSVVIYYEKVVTTALTCHNEHAYLMGIAKNLWLRKFNNAHEGPLNNNILADIEDPENEQPSTARLLHYLEKAGQKCMNLLKAFYYDQLPVQEVANQFGYSGIRSATVQKYKCLEKVRDTVKQKSLHYEDFID